MAEYENPQDAYLEDLVKTGSTCNVYLMNGIRLVGNLLSHDNYVLVLKGKDNTGKQLIYKHAVSTVSLVS